MRKGNAAWWLLGCLLAGSAIAGPGTAHADAVVAPAVHARAQAEGVVRVIVALAPPRAPLARAGERQREVEATADAVLARLPTRGHVVRHRFATVPALALDVDAATLRRLASDPLVARIDLDGPGRGHAQAPDEASVLNGIAMVNDLGLDGAGRKVAIVDSGVFAGHPDLGARLVDEQCFCTRVAGPGGCCPNHQSTQSGPGAARDDNGHGTNIAGIILGTGGTAPRGAAPAASFVAVKVLDQDNAFCCTSDVIAALDWIIRHHPDVDAVNMSLGTFALYAGHCDGSTAGNMALATAIDTLTALGAVVTASTGNQAREGAAASPACIANTVGVGATWDARGGPITFLGCSEVSRQPWQPTCFSNHSSTTDLYAAGALVTSTGYLGGTSVQGGTSQASAMVAGCAVLLAQAAPGATAPERAGALRRTPRTVTHGPWTYPLLDCDAALMESMTVRACAAGATAPTCCAAGEPGCRGGIREAADAARPPAGSRRIDGTAPTLAPGNRGSSHDPTRHDP